MTMGSITTTEWQRLLGSLELQSFEKVAGALADARGLSEDQARTAVDEAIDAGVLIETDTGAFGTVELADRPETDALNGEDTDSPDANPGGKADETGDTEAETDQESDVDADGGTDDYHVPIDDDTIAAHYDRSRGVYERLATVQDYPTMGLDDLAGWYITRDETDVERLEDGYTKRRRPATFEKDLDTVLARVDRTVYGLTTYKSPEAFRRWTPARLNESNEYEYPADNPTPRVDDLRAVAVWGDIDLRDELKGERGDLDAETKATAEATLEAYAEEFGRLVGGTDAVYGLDSVGGAYLFTAPEATVAIAEHVLQEHGEEWVGTVLRAVIDRSNDYLKEAQERVENRIDGASEVIDPDWANNHNRKYKAPLAIHKDHDAVVTPINTDDVDYSITRLDDVDGELITESEQWAEQFTESEHTDRTEALVSELFDTDESESWREAIDRFVEQRREEQEKREELRNQGRPADCDRDLDLAEFDITPSVSDVERAIDDLDITAVADDTIVSRWTERESGLTDRSGTGKKAIVPTWAGSYNSGNATYIDLKKGIFVDTDSGDHGTAVEMALIDREGWPKGQIAEGADWARGVQHLRDLGHDIPVWTPDAETADGDQMPYWALRSAAIALGVVEETDLVERDSETGEVVEDADSAADTYRGFPPGTYREAIEAVEDAGLETARELPETEDATDDREANDEYTRDPRQVDVVIEPKRAWKAASRVTPDQLDGPIALDETDDGDAWRCPETDARIDDVARAVAIAEGMVADVEVPLSEDYARAYQLARDRYGAPLPEYLTNADSVERFDYVLGAIRELDFFHLDRDAITAEITGEGLEVAGEAQLTIDPSPVDGWRDSESGESVLVFPSGTVWDADLGDDGQVIDTLRFVAADAGVIDDPSESLEGEAFTEAYRIARDEYGAPLPRWNAGAPNTTPILPPAEELVEDGLEDGPEADELRELWDAVEELYRSIAADDSDGTAGVNVLRALPGLGKTTSAIKSASESPSTYLAPRKELMAQAKRKAEKWDVTAAHLPIFAEANLNPEALEEAVAFVREHGKDKLRDRWAVLDAVDAELWDTDDGSDGSDDGEDVELNRPTCPTAEGEHGDAWALVVHVARELDYTPRDIHERADALFGTDLPCQESGDCEYSVGWDAIADPADPIDLLIGHYGHGHVESARTYYESGQSVHTKRSPRTIILDEFPGLSFAEHFGDEAIDHAVWLASALHDDVRDRHDLFERDLWGDGFVRQWLEGEAATDGGPTSEIAAVLRSRRKALEAAETASEIRSEYRELLETHDLLDAVSRVAAEATALGADEQNALAGTIASSVEALPGDADGRPVLNWIEDEVVAPLTEAALGSMGVETDGGVSDVVDELPNGDLRRLVERALEASDGRSEGATGLLAAAETAVEGGRAGCRELAVWADDGYAHRKAHVLLKAAICPVEDGDGVTIPTSEFTFGDDDETTLKSLQVDGDAVLFDRGHKGAAVLSPPEFVAGDGNRCPVVGLDATARKRLWEVVFGDRYEVELQDIHDSPRERAQCLRDIHNLQIVQTSDLMNSYEGDPDGKNLDDDVALLQEIVDRFAGVHGPRGRDAESTVVGKPATITTKCVRQVLEEDGRLDDVVSEWENYGNLTGDNSLGGHQLAALLGCQHYGDRAVEQFAAFAGERIDRSGYGSDLDYGSEVANEYLGHMRKDQVMQAALRFARGDSGALVFAHTAALHEDLPVVGQGQVIDSWSPTATTIAEEWRRTPGAKFTVGDVADAVDVKRRQVRRILDEFVKAGYLDRHRTPNGHANEFTPKGAPSAGEVDLEDVDRQKIGDRPGQSDLEVYYTANVRVVGVDSSDLPRPAGRGSSLPAPEVADAGGESVKPPD